VNFSQLRSIVIPPGYQKRNAERSGHDALLAISTLTKSQGQITYRLRAALNPELLIIVECVVLALDASVLDHASRVSLQSRHRASDVGVYFYYLFDGRGDEEGGGHALFDAEEYAV
jgi:hypothetical protein